MKKLLLLIAILTCINAAHAQRYRGFGDEHPKFRFGMQGGWSYMIAKISDAVPVDFRQYVRDLKSGYHFGADGSFFLNRTIGLGIKYSGFRTSNEMDIVAMDTATLHLVQGKLKDDITIHYVGPSFSTRYMSQNERFHFIASVSAGYLSYTNNTVQMTPYKLTSGTVGVVTSAGADFAVHENIFLGAEVSLTTGTLSYYQVETNAMSQRVDLEEDQQEGISRVDVSAGIRFNF